MFLVYTQVVVYGVGVDSRMTAKEFMKLSDASKLKLLMSKSSEETFVKDFEKFLLPFLKNIGRVDYQKRQELLHEFLVEIAKTDLTCCWALFKKCSPEVCLLFLTKPVKLVSDRCAKIS